MSHPVAHPISKIPSVAAKQVAQDNAVSADVVKLQVELNEINKALAANPSRVDATVLNTRKAAINVELAQASIDGPQ